MTHIAHDHIWTKHKVLYKEPKLPRQQVTVAMTSPVPRPQSAQLPSSSSRTESNMPNVAILYKPYTAVGFLESMVAFINNY